MSGAFAAMRAHNRGWRICLQRRGIGLPFGFLQWMRLTLPSVEEPLVLRRPVGAVGPDVGEGTRDISTFAQVGRSNFAPTLSERLISIML